MWQAANYLQLHNLFVFYYSGWEAKVFDGPVSSVARGRPGVPCIPNTIWAHQKKKLNQQSMETSGC